MQVRLSVVPWLQGTTSTYESARGRRAGDTARQREGGDAPERVLEEFLARLLRVGQALDLVDGLLVRAHVPQLQEGGTRSQLARLLDPVHSSQPPPSAAAEKQERTKPTHPVARDDEEVVVGSERRLGRVRRADDELLHLRVAERARDGEVAVDALVQDVAAGGLDALDLLGVAALVVVREADGATVAAARARGRGSASARRSKLGSRPRTSRRRE